MNLSFFKNRHHGERCFVVCNGPSLNNMDLSFLRQEIVFGMNKIYLGLPEFRFYPRYVVVINEKVIRQSLNHLLTMTSVKFVGDRFKLPIGKVNDPLLWRIQTELFSDDFSFDLSAGIQEGNTVTYATLQLAYFMGFTQVIIVGMDHRFEFIGATNESQVLRGPDCNHFSESYFGDQEWDTPDLERSEKFYGIARDVFNQDGRDIFDATINGACNVFKKRDYREFFN